MAVEVATEVATEAEVVPVLLLCSLATRSLAPAQSLDGWLAGPAGNAAAPPPTSQLPCNG